MIEHSEALNELAAALAKAQAEMKGALKDSTNPHFNSRYAGLDSTWEACRPALTAHGLSVVQAPSASGSSVGLTTLLLHTSGQWIRSTLDMTARDASPQAIGSCITYARRYGLSAMAGIAPEDDDGNAAQGAGAPAPRGRGGRQELTNDQRREVADKAPYAEREKAKAPTVVDTETGEVKEWVPPSFKELMARRAKLPEDVRDLVPQTEDLLNFPPTELTDLIPGYLDAIADAVTRRKLAPKERGDLKEQFFGHRTASLDAAKHNPFFIYALFRHMRTDQP